MDSPHYLIIKEPLEKRRKGEGGGRVAGLFHRTFGSVPKSFMIIAGDIGGTKTLLGLFPLPTKNVGNGKKPERLFEREYPSAHYASLENALEDFLKDLRSECSPPPAIEAAAFGIAGPVVNGRCQTTNLPWVVETDTIAGFLNLPKSRVRLANDLVAIAWGTTLLDGNETIPINEGIPNPSGARIIVAPGTGLGESILVPGPSGPVILPTEGGHTDWAPESPADLPFLTFLWSRFGHASCERVISGQGFVNLYRFYTQDRPVDRRPIGPEVPESDLPAAITHVAMTRQDPLCLMILENFCRFLAQESGNLALKALSTGGVFLAGGIPGKIRTFLQHPSFMEHFSNKGRYRPLLSGIPVHIVDHPDIGILGAWRLACQSIGQSSR